MNKINQPFVELPRKKEKGLKVRNERGYITTYST